MTRYPYYERTNYYYETDGWGLYIIRIMRGFWKTAVSI